MEEQYVVVTHYNGPKATVVHAYAADGPGLIPARTLRRRIRSEARINGYLDLIRVTVCKILDGKEGKGVQANPAKVEGGEVPAAEVPRSEPSWASGGGGVPGSKAEALLDAVTRRGGSNAAECGHADDVLKGAVPTPRPEDPYQGQCIDGPDVGNLISSLVPVVRFEMQTKHWLDGLATEPATLTIRGRYTWSEERAGYVWAPDGRQRYQ